MNWTSAITGLIAGAIGSLIAPWVKWGIEKRREKLSYRKNKLANWRILIESADSYGDIVGTSVYREIEPYMSENEKSDLNTKAVIIGGPPNIDSRLSKLLRIVTRIEKEWDLI